MMNGDLVGTLTRTSSGTLEFKYAQVWLESQLAQPISCSIPLREEIFRELNVNAYFDNLLPENESIRRKIAEKFQAEGKTAFDLLTSIGRDCIGALQFIPEDENLNFSAEPQGEALAERDIADLLKNLGTYPLGLGRDREFRISLAGAQEKTALLRWNDKWCRPIGPTATTHIFKPAIGELPNGIDMTKSVENEWLCLKITEHFGLPSARAEIAEFEGKSCLIVERFDRRWTRDLKSLYRIPQEDLCQALGVPWSRKYESDGGPGMKTIMQFLDASDLRDRDREQFMRAQIVFFLIGAIDGHAKNFSITLSPTGFHLTPIYDVMTVLPAVKARQVEEKETKLAMTVGDSRHWLLRDIFRRHWEQTAKKCGFPQNALNQLIDDLTERANGLPARAAEYRKNVGDEIVDTVLEGLDARVNALKN